MGKRTHTGPVRVGDVRPSSMLTTYGVGSIVDLPRISVIVRGLESWTTPDERIEEPRLLAAVRGAGLETVTDLNIPPRADADGADAHRVGVGVSPFPGWLLCPACRLLARRDSGDFTLTPNRFSVDQNGYRHAGCPKVRGSGGPWAIPVRFVAACENGHLDDFPWVAFAHPKNPGCDAPRLELRERGVAGSAADVFVHCRTCDDGRSLATAFGEDNRQRNMPPCTGRHPHLDKTEECGNPRNMRAMLLGASNLWFPVRRSALTLPRSAALTKLAAHVLHHAQWTTLRALRDNAAALGALLATPDYADLAAEAVADIQAAIAEAEAAATGDAEVVTQDELLAEEWAVLARDGATRTDDLETTLVATPHGYDALIERVVLVQRLREVAALIGFTRIDAPYDDEFATARVGLSRRPPTWVPVSVVRGEGVFIQLRESAVDQWVSGHAELDASFLTAHRAWREARAKDDLSAGYPGLRYVLLHTLSHALMRRVSLASGYAQASLRERIYSAPAEAGRPAMAGILLMTAAPDSEGTLGGLVEQGKPTALRVHLDAAIRGAALCSSDPYCAEHDRTEDPLGIHGAACHACLFAPETSCERGNRYLDRAVMAPLVTNIDVAFFPKA